MVTIITMYNILKPEWFLSVASYAMCTLVHGLGIHVQCTIQMRGMVSLFLHVHVGEELLMNIYTSA